jgi:membrane protease YdiL (CAAX protease family)
MNNFDEKQSIKQDTYPSFIQSLAILGIIFLCMLLFLPLIMWGDAILRMDIVFLFYYLLAMGSAFGAVHLIRKQKTGQVSYSFKPFPWYFILIIPLIALGLQIGVTLPMIQWLPYPAELIEAMEIFNQSSWFIGFITLAIVAPVIEEFIFRGIILDGLLKRYSPTFAILMSSLLFAFVHLNPWQFISAMNIGILSGWLYYRTRNLWLPIFVHVVNNSFPLFLDVFTDIDFSSDLTSLYGGSEWYVLVVLTSIGIVILGLLFLNWLIPKVVNE